MWKGEIQILADCPALERQTTNIIETELIIYEVKRVKRHKKLEHDQTDTILQR